MKTFPWIKELPGSVSNVFFPPRKARLRPGKPSFKTGQTCTNMFVFYMCVCMCTLKKNKTYRASLWRLTQMGESIQATRIRTGDLEKWPFPSVVTVSDSESHPSSTGKNVLPFPDSSPGGSWNELVLQNQIFWITKAIIIKSLQGSLSGRLVGILGKVQETFEGGGGIQGTRRLFFQSPKPAGRYLLRGLRLPEGADGPHSPPPVYGFCAPGL